MIHALRFYKASGRGVETGGPGGALAPSLILQKIMFHSFYSFLEKNVLYKAIFHLLIFKKL